MNYSYKILWITLLVSFISACGFFDTDNTPAPTPLTKFQPQRYPQLAWTVKVSPAEKTFSRYDPVANDASIFTTNRTGMVTAVNKTTGQIIWRTSTHLTPLSGPGYGNGLVVVGDKVGYIAALDSMTGNIVWRQYVNGQILAKPAVKNGYVVIKTVDGSTHGLSEKTGEHLWTSQQEEPNLILRLSSTPVIYGNYVVVGYANGNLAKLKLLNGDTYWEEAIAIPTGGFSIERMIDIDADPVIYNGHVYAATYQGRIASLNWRTGDTRWMQFLSSYTGMVADDNKIMITDAKGYVWAFNADNGDSIWRQNRLAARVLTAPASMENTIVMGDAAGYLHWLSKADGHFVARIGTGDTPIYATPLTESNIVYVYNNNGYLSAYVVK